VNVTDTKLENLFLCGKDRLISRSTHDGKLIHPQAVLRRTTKIIHEFYNLKIKDKFDYIERYRNYINCTTGLTPYLESELASPSQLLPTVTRQPRGEEGVAAGSVRSTHSVIFADKLPVRIEQPSSCGGITLEYIRGMTRIALHLRLGFKRHRLGPHSSSPY
jgi:hypothetical protein